MPIANVALSDTFDLWRTRFNQVVQITNGLTEGSYTTSGVITVTNPTYLNGNVSVNVSNGVICVQGNTFSSNAITFTSNNTSLRVSGSGRLGTTVYFDIGSLSISTADQATGNIASANTVNLAYTQATLAFDQANAAYNIGNTAYVQSNSIFDRTNSALTQANTAYNQANIAYNVANTAGGYYRGNNGDHGQAANKADIFRINANTLTANIYFSAGENASATGPLYLDPNVSITINTGARVVII